MPLVKINLACGEAYFLHNWLNIDIKNQLNRPEKANFVVADLKIGIPLRSDSVDIIYSSHFLEHLDPFEESHSFLRECFRILKSNGILRIVVPDFYRIASIYLDDPRSFYKEYNYKKPWFDKARTWNRRFGISIMYGHKMLYDRVSLEEVLENSGFNTVTNIENTEQSPLLSNIVDEIIATHTSHSIVMDAIK